MAFKACCSAGAGKAGQDGAGCGGGAGGEGARADGGPRTGSDLIPDVVSFSVGIWI